MSNHYGQSITWGPLSAPQLFTGQIVSYDYNDQSTQQNIEGAASDFIAMAIHSRKGEISFESTVTSGSTDFLDLSDAKAAIAVGGLSAGLVLCSEAVEKWQLGQPKTCSIRATHYPDMTGTVTPAALTTLDAFTPDQAGLGIVFPGDEIIYGTFGLGHAAGVVHALTLTQSLSIAEDEPSPDGKILGAASHGYQRKISLDILAKAAIPAVASVLTLTGAPGHAADYRIISASTKFSRAKGKMYTIEAAWIPPFAA